MDIPGSGLRIDKFTRGARHYALTHFHSDHMSGLKRGWDRGPLLCSPVTARLLAARFRIPAGRLVTLAPGESRNLGEGLLPLKVRALEANHCPGALMFHLTFDGREFLYTGDFRYEPELMADLPAGVDTLWYDSTYEHPRYRFPPQAVVIEEIIDLIRARPRRRVFIGTYQIGKNRVLAAVAAAFGEPFYVPRDRQRFYRLIGQEGIVTDDPGARFHSYSLGYFYNEYFRRRFPDLDRKGLVILPTGWALDRPAGGGVYHHLPYSEHSSYPELQAFLERVRPKKKIRLVRPPPD